MKFVIPGKPRPQERPLVLRSGWAIDRPASKAAKRDIAHIALCSRQAHRLSILGGDVRVKAIFYGAHGSADIDNLTKLVLDALKGIIWHDDRQVVMIEARKVRDKENPRTEVEIEQIESEAA